jgi:hypothetical protein
MGDHMDDMDEDMIQDEEMDLQMALALSMQVANAAADQGFPGLLLPLQPASKLHIHPIMQPYMVHIHPAPACSSQS